MVRTPPNFYTSFYLGTFTVPATAVLGRPLRLRVAQWVFYPNTQFVNVPSPCLREETGGQVRDFTVMVTAPLASPAPVNSSSVALFPNPSTGQFTLQSETLLQSPVQVRNTTGQLVLEQVASKDPSRTIELDLRQLPAGIYFLHLPQSRLIRKISIMH